MKKEKSGSKKPDYDYHSNGSACSSGTLRLDIRPAAGKSFTNFTEDEMRFMQSDALAGAVLHMMQRGWVQLMSSQDIAETYGKQRQHWDRLLREGKIEFVETSAGRMTTNLWVEAYLRNKEEIDRYCRMKNRVLKEIKKSGQRSLLLICPQCNNQALSCAYNITDWTKRGEKCNANGVCGMCGFQFCELV